ncbi:DUF4136 domain-containing protein [Leptospira koniambonensis]|uniref:DUF4136 domain-containing protein n=2 Tax=Leptospira koniambonensis TaxID=2484950 RepID=A0A4R9J7J6_9LEPT|nr:DUF4136 domain-containing protein [Leptospira koniambonensis]
MNLFRTSNIFFCFLLLMLDCSAAQIESSYDKSLDFTKYKTFTWYPSSEKGDQQYFGDFKVQEEIRNLLQKELESKGLKLDLKKPDLLVEYHGIIQNKIVEDRSPAFSGLSYGYTPYYAGTPYGMSPYFGGYNSMYPYGYNNVPYYVPSQTYIQEFKDGTLLVDIVDRKTNQLVWRGWAEDTLDDLDDLKSELKREIPKLMQSFPGAKSKN